MADWQECRGCGHQCDGATWDTECSRCKEMNPEDWPLARLRADLAQAREERDRVQAAAEQMHAQLETIYASAREPETPNETMMGDYCYSSALSEVLRLRVDRNWWKGRADKAEAELRRVRAELAACDELTGQLLKSREEERARANKAEAETGRHRETIRSLLGWPAYEEVTPEDVARHRAALELARAVRRHVMPGSGRVVWEVDGRAFDAYRRTLTPPTDSRASVARLAAAALAERELARAVLAQMRDTDRCLFCDHAWTRRHAAGCPIGDYHRALSDIATPPTEED